MDNAEERKGCFTASNIGRLLAGGAGSTRKAYILEVALDGIGCRAKNLDTGATKHGIANQMNAFDFVLKPMYKGIEWADTYIPINKDCGASPDCIWNGNYPIDIKCPYEIDTYLEQVGKMKTAYFYQLQMQMLAVKGDRSALCTYLTKKEEWGSDEWEEYPMPLEDRFHIEEVAKDEEVCDRILSSVLKAAPERDLYIECLLNATEMEEVEYFYYQMKHNKCRPIKECGNIPNAEIIRVNNNFYYKLK